MTTEEKNALAKEYADENKVDFILQLQCQDCSVDDIVIWSHNAGYDVRDKEVSDLVEALREARKDHIEHRTLSEGVALDSPYAQGVIAHNEFVDDLDELLSKYPVNTLPNG